MGWFILNKYYSLTDDSPAYAAAVLLDPTKRRAYIEKNWPCEWHSSAIDSVTQLWETEYKDLPPLTVPSVSSDAAAALGRTTTKRQQKDVTYERLRQRVAVEPPTADSKDTLEHFISSPVIKVEGTALEWWIQNRGNYPRLSRMAIDILSIPPQSAEPERTFSGARRTLSWDRLSMTISTLEQVECIGNWIKHGHVEAIIDVEADLVDDVILEGDID